MVQRGPRARDLSEREGICSVFNQMGTRGGGVVEPQVLPTLHGIVSELSSSTLVYLILGDGGPCGSCPVLLLRIRAAMGRLIGEPGGSCSCVPHERAPNRTASRA